jgi:hypothetical protein
MAEATLNDVVTNLKADNKRLTSIEQNTLDTKKALNKFLATQQAMAGDQLEAMRELGGGSQGAGSKTPAPDAPGGGGNIFGFIGGLGLIGKTVTAIAAAFGVGLGLIMGQVKAIKTYIKILTPSGIIKSIDSLKASWVSKVDDLKLKATTKITSITTAIGAAFDDMKAKFTINPESAMGKALAKVSGIATRVGDLFDNIKAKFSIGPKSTLGLKLATVTTVFTDMGTQIGKITTPITSAATTIKEVILDKVKSIKNWFHLIGSRVGRFGGIVTKVAGVVGKVFAPIAIVTTAWETITGIIDGWKEDGFLGALKGGIEGFATSLLTVPLDLITNLVGWLVGLFGFDETAQVLKDFSFTDLFTNMLDGLFDFVDKAIAWVKTLFTDPVAALKELYKGIYGEEGLINTLVWKPISKAIDWVMKKFGFSDEDAPPFDLYTTLTDTYAKIKTAFTNGLTDIVNWFKRTPQLVALEAEEALQVAIVKLKKGFLGVAKFLGDLPNRVTLGVIESIGWIGDWIPGMEKAAKAAQASLDERELTATKGFQKLDEELAQTIRNIDERRAKVNAANTRQPSPNVNVGGDNNSVQDNSTSNTTVLKGETTSSVDATYEALP